MRNQGRDGAGGWLTHVRIGYNYRLSELSAAIGGAQIGRMDYILQRRRDVAAYYNQVLADIEDITLPPMAEPQTASWFVYVIRLSDRFTYRDRQAIVEAMAQHGIGCERYFQPIHLQPYLTERFGWKTGDFHNCELVADRTIALPFFTTMQPEQVAIVADRLKAVLASCR